MIPDLQCTVAFKFTHNAVRCRNTVVGSLEYAWYLFGDRDREYEKI
jgi:hypothetical protein